jgi:hypothetical protein
MSQEARDQFLQEKREGQGQQRGGRGRGGRGRGGRSQRRSADEAEAEMADAGGVECFNSEITRELSELSNLGRENMDIPTILEKPRVLFADTAESKDTDQEHDESPEVESSPVGDCPHMESSPTDSAPSSSWSPIWLIALVTFILSIAAGVSESVRAIVHARCIHSGKFRIFSVSYKQYFQLLRNTTLNCCSQELCCLLPPSMI